MLSKKRITIVLLSLFIGYGAGWMAFHIPTFASLVHSARKAGITKEQITKMEILAQQAMQKIEDEDREAVAMSITVLDLLGEEKTDEAKQFLASILVEFYTQYGSEDHSEEKEISQSQKDFLGIIEEISEFSPILKQAIKEATK